MVISLQICVRQRHPPPAAGPRGDAGQGGHGGEEKPQADQHGRRQ